jgi:hypothetical protein
LGYVAGEMLMSDAMLQPVLETMPRVGHTLLPVVCAVLVMVLGKVLAVRRAAAMPAVDLLDEQASAASDGKH